MTSAQLVTVEVMGGSAPVESQFDYQLITNPEDRDWAESAAGFITFDLGQAVVKVLKTGNILAEAKRRLPHGEYLPWVKQACGLKPKYAALLIQAAEWMSNVQHAGHLDGIADVTTLFLLSADATPDHVREWVMERCRAGNPPSRKEVQERKQSAGRPRPPQPTELLALTILRKGELERMREALALAERAEVVTPAQVMAEQRLRDLGKQRFIPGADADFHRMKDGAWVRLPHVTPLREPDPEREPALETQLLITESAAQRAQGELVSVDRAAGMVGMTHHSLTSQLTPSATEKRGGPLIRNGLAISRDKRGFVRVTPVGI